MKEDKLIKGHQTSQSQMVVTSAQSLNGTVFISNTEKSFVFRVLNIRNDGSKCEFLADDYDLRAARKALNLMAEIKQWDSE